jgi:hypothetical protein
MKPTMDFRGAKSSVTALMIAVNNDLLFSVGISVWWYWTQLLGGGKNAMKKIVHTAV